MPGEGRQADKIIKISCSPCIDIPAFPLAQSPRRAECQLSLCKHGAECKQM
ncbi:hypothetical protein [Caudoviricetes sp.]|nr:hypothetical protein [Caudoviricetes sp.]